MNTKQFIKLLGVFAVFYWIAHALMYLVGERAGQAFGELLSILPYIIAAVCAISLVMFTYVDNTAKDLTDVRNDVDRSKYVFAQTRLSDLKKEVLSNVGTVIFFFVVERMIKAIAEHLISEQSFSNLWLVAVCGTSLRFACFAVIAIASGCQLLGFIIAVEFRELIASNRK